MCVLELFICTRATQAANVCILYVCMLMAYKQYLHIACDVYTCTPVVHSMCLYICLCMHIVYELCVYMWCMLCLCVQEYIHVYRCCIGYVCAFMVRLSDMQFRVCVCDICYMGMYYAVHSVFTYVCICMWYSNGICCACKYVSMYISDA